LKTFEKVQGVWCRYCAFLKHPWNYGKRASFAHCVKSGNLGEKRTDFEVKCGKSARIMGIGVMAPLDPAPHLVFFHEDVSIRFSCPKSCQQDA
jgi:hypothetical protein